MQIDFHAGQLPIYLDKHKVRALCAGRRFGKTGYVVRSAFLDVCSYQGSTDPLSPEVILMTEPTLLRAKALLWRPLLTLFESPEVAPYVKKIDRSEYWIELHGGKPRIQLGGTNDPRDNLRGLRMWRYYGDEFQDTRAGFLDAIVVPAMADSHGSRAMVSFTPKGTLNHTYEIAERAKTDPDYVFFHKVTADNPFVPKAEIERARRVLVPRLFRQEMEASFEAFEGQIYTSFTLDNVVDKHPLLEEMDLRILGIDWGDVNPAIVALGRKEDKWYTLGGWQGSTGLPIEEPTLDRKIEELAKFFKIHGAYCDPSRPSAILRIRAIDAPGLKSAIAGYNAIEEGISQVGSLIYQDRLLFPETPMYTSKDPGYRSPQDISKLMQNYHRDIDRLGVVLDRVAPGQDDHCVDGIRYGLTVKTGSIE